MAVNTDDDCKPIKNGAILAHDTLFTISWIYFEGEVHDEEDDYIR